jgi:hypothetical protein
MTTSGLLRFFGVHEPHWSRSDVVPVVVDVTRIGSMEEDAPTTRNEEEFADEEPA